MSAKETLSEEYVLVDDGIDGVVSSEVTHLFETFDLSAGNASNMTNSHIRLSDYNSDENLLTDFDWSPDQLLRYSPSVSSIYFVAYTLVFVLGIIGNSFVVAVVCRSPRMRTVTNYFIVNLALADILVLLFCLPATLLSNLFIRK